MPILVGKEVGTIGYGTMRITSQARPPTQEACFETLNKTLELGANFCNDGELYSTPKYNSLHLLYDYFTKYPQNADKVVLSIEGGLKLGTMAVHDGKKKIDIYECARQDPKYPIKHIIEILAQYMNEG